ncbi:hypothetical protein [Fuerstiella marisgermanici]|uniref:Uncharacterized protein n=1 Tax=Fuerstiella marisgermanici TaxID=1891926 RepID=A0A1P8WD61_9PLAN|nr:hypothetical protein [Fuerstiella marisgermanici]APZ92006.1 hypothetical protein Fuma_01607 [Fuerstiella marisgermanici]
MFFRFVASLILVVLVSMVGIGLEKQTLQMKRAVSRQYFQKDLLLEMHARLRLSIQQLTAPSQLAAVDEARQSSLSPQIKKAERWQMPQQTTTANSNAQADHSSSARNSQDRSSSDNTRLPPRLPLLRWEHPAGTGR